MSDPTVVDNGDGTFTINGQTTVVDNGDGTFTISGPTVIDNGDGTFTITDGAALGAIPVIVTMTAQRPVTITSSVPA